MAFKEQGVGERGMKAKIDAAMGLAKSFNSHYHKILDLIKPAALRHMRQSAKVCKQSTCCLSS